MPSCPSSPIRPSAVLPTPFARRLPSSSSSALRGAFVCVFYPKTFLRAAFLHGNVPRGPRRPRRPRRSELEHVPLSAHRGGPHPHQREVLLAIVARHTPPDGTLAKRFNRVTGT